MALAESTVVRGQRIRGRKQYELANHLGHVLATISDRVIFDPVVNPTKPKADILSATDYFPFGMPLPGRFDEARTYRFGANGFERDDELKGPGNSLYTPARLYDPRAARFLSVDSIAKAQRSPFSAFSSNPLRFSDTSGRMSWDRIKDIAIAAGETYVDMQKDNLKMVSKMVTAIPEGIANNLMAAKAAALEGQIVEAAGWATGMNSTLKALADQTNDFQKAGASTGESFGLAVGDMSGMNQFMEGITGETLYAKALSPGERLESIVVGATRVIGTAAAIADAGIQVGKGLSGTSAKPKVGAGPCSFPPGTLVTTPAGGVAIELLSPGDLVLSRDEQSGVNQWRSIDARFATMHSDFITLGVILGVASREEYISTTPEHPFWVKDQGWVEAAEVTVGDEILSAGGQWVRIGSSQWVAGRQVAYNLAVHSLSSYYVGNAAVWVHNACPIGEKVHGNRLDSPKPAEGYHLMDKTTGEIKKYGETTRGPKRYSQTYLKEKNLEMVFEAKGTKREMHQWQHNKILEHTELTGERPRLNKSNW